jgi:hypothetical protein
MTKFVIVETLPKWTRESHKAAGNSGSYPGNGADRVRMLRNQAEVEVEADPEWTSILRGCRRGDPKKYETVSEL